MVVGPSARDELHELVDLLDARLLAESVFEADVAAADGPDGATQYTGKSTPSAPQAAYGEADPYRVELLTAHADQLLDGISVQLVVGADGTLRSVSFTRRSAWTHPTLSSVTSVTTLDYSGLHTPQTIEAPTVG